MPHSPTLARRTLRSAAGGAWWLLLAVLCGLPLTGHADPRAENFMLLDHRGEAQELYYQSDAEAVVIQAGSNACDGAGAMHAQMVDLAARYPTVRFWQLNAEDDRAAILTAVAGDSPVAVLEDSTQIISESLDFRQAGDTLVVDPKTWAVRFRGGASQTEAALSALLAGADMPEPDPVQAEGNCGIAYRDSHPDHGAISYADTIAPMLEQHCVHCHSEGGIGPWAMESYDMVRGFAPMIREVLRTKRMPPWHTDPHIGQWQGDRSLDDEAVRTLVQWIEAGAPRGSGPDPLTALAPQSSDWPLGEPDLIVDIPGFEVAASGVVDYQFPYVKNELDHGVWIRAATVLPGDRRVVHHVLAGSVEGEQPPAEGDSVMDNYIIGYAPGAESYVMPEGTGVYIAPGGHFTFQMHYTPIGRVVVDNSRMGLYLSEEPPANFLRHTVVISPDLNIPPNTPDHEEAAYYEFHDDVIIHTLFPHSHYRGKSSSFEVAYPDGRLETVLSVPNYDFNWQRGYDPVEPLTLPAGSRLIHRTVYDNSAKNPANPDPHQTVHWGLQSFEEMLYGAFSYSWANETSENPIHDRTRSSYTQFVGFLDRNMDGKVSWRELPDRMKRRLIQGFKAVDTNGDGGLDVNEFIALMGQRGLRGDGDEQENDSKNGETGD